jgi:hypothetical protein
MASTYSPGYPVPSALTGLTSLFGMERGGPRRNRHLKLYGLHTNTLVYRYNP